MSIFLNPVVMSVAVMIILCLLKLNIIISIMIAAMVGGFAAGMPIGIVFENLIGGMGNNSDTALSYILLGALAFAIQESGLAAKLGRSIERGLGKNGKLLVFGLALIACFSQNLVPVHIAFIPILIPPLLHVFNKLKLDRRAVACALTFGLKAPYLLIPAGFGSIFHGVVAKNLTDNGLPFEASNMWKSTIIPVIGMAIGLCIAVFISYRKPREYEDKFVAEEKEVQVNFTKEHLGAALGAFTAFAVQLFTTYYKFPVGSFMNPAGGPALSTGSLPLGAMCGLIVMLLFGTIKFKLFDNVINKGVGMMGFIAFVMLVAAGYAEVIRSTGGVEELVTTTASVLGNNQLLGAFVLLIIGLLITLGIGTSFGTTPIVAVIYVPLCAKLGFSPYATAALVAVAAALGDAGSPASDSTLGPTSGLNADGQHDHIWDTCVPTFLHFNIPLIIFGMIAAMVL